MMDAFAMDSLDALADFILDHSRRATIAEIAKLPSASSTGDNHAQQHCRARRCERTNRHGLLPIMSPHLLSLIGVTFASSVAPGPNNVVIASIGRTLVLEQGMGTAGGHDEAIALVNRLLDRFEMPTPKARRDRVIPD